MLNFVYSFAQYFNMHWGKEFKKRKKTHKTRKKNTKTSMAFKKWNVKR